MKEWSMVMKIRYLFLILCLFFSEKIAQAKTVTGEKIAQLDQVPGLTRDDNRAKAIYLISTPRSCSTAFLRMMHTRGDFVIINEPGVQPYYRFYKSSGAKFLKAFQEVKNKILQKLGNYQKNVFVKEMGYSACKYLSPESDFLKKQNYYTVFLVRNPHHALVSNYKKWPNIVGILDDIMGYRQLYELFKKFQQKASNVPIIILAEELTVDSHKVVSQFCQHVGIPFKEESLSWQKMDENFPFEYEWNCHVPTPTQDASNWFDKAMVSNGFKDEHLTKYAVDEHGQPTFEEIKNVKHREFYKKLYVDNMPYYKLFLEEYYKYKQAKSC